MTPEEIRLRWPNATPSLVALNCAPEAPTPAQAEATTRADKASGRREVAELHKPFKNWCNLHGIEAINPRSDQRSTIENGWPDFTCIYGTLVCCIEFKWPGGNLSENQSRVRLRLRASGTPYLIAYNVQDAIAFARKALQFEVVA